MRIKSKLIVSIMATVFCFCTIAKAQNAEAGFSDTKHYGLYNLLADDLGETCKAKKSYSGTVSKLAGNSENGNSIYSFFLTPPKGKRTTVSLILTDSEISQQKVKRFLSNGRKVKVIARNCDGQITAVEIISALPLNKEP